MVHNGIEYGMMAAYAEGLNLLEHANAGSAEHEVDAETTPLRDPEHYRYEIDTAKVAEVWRRGTVVRSLAARPGGRGARRGPDARVTSPGRVSDSGEGRWTALAAIDTGTPTPVLTAALQERFSSRGEADFADRLLSAMREQFGGHAREARRAGAPVVSPRDAGRRARHLRDDRRPRLPPDLPGAAADDPGRRPERAGRRRRARALEPRQARERARESLEASKDGLDPAAFAQLC